MKYLIIVLVLIASKLNAQDTVKISVTLQARDAEFIGYYISFNEQFENLFDSTKLFFRVPSPPTGTTTIKIDSIPIYQWLGVSLRLRNNPLAILGGVHSRVATALTNVNNSYLNSRLSAMDAEDTSDYMRIRVLGRFKLRGN